MAQGINRADPAYKRLQEQVRANPAVKSLNEKRSKPCIFISHKRDDTKACAKIADYLLEIDLDVYFDYYDYELAQIAAQGNPDKLTKKICDGIDNSTHMLCVVSLKTVESYWVPFEVGYGYDKIPLGILTLKGMEDERLPDCMKTVSIVRGTKSLNALIARLLGQSRKLLEEERIIKSYSAHNHPLDNVLDWWR
ncbi:MAG: toll/interleukin-1 receptor domain-containing protein [Armatimonadota bacterium]|nr:toll/interleukin-1 receptor domain-containing protein [Armatimonadota bacterium]